MGYLPATVRDDHADHGTAHFTQRIEGCTCHVHSDRAVPGELGIVVTTLEV
jgi:hypothetical protein